MSKALLFLIAAEGKRDALQSAITAGVEQHLGDQPNITVQLMREPEMDFFYNPEAPYPRPHLVLEVITAPGKPMSSVHGALQQIMAAAPVDNASFLLLMQERKYIPGPPEPIYYHYLMVKREGFATSDYIDYYSNFHSRMGLNTPGLGAYSQNYVDQAGSEELGQLLGLESKAISSISEMKIPDVIAFVSSPELVELAGPAGLDEERFVDRENSVSFMSEVIFSIGDFEKIDEPVFDQHFPA
jgi:hypothetical protein